jgi:hypothetical protein
VIRDLIENQIYELTTFVDKKIKKDHHREESIFRGQSNFMVSKMDLNAYLVYIRKTEV